MGRKPSEPMRPAPYGVPGAPFADESGIHITRYRDLVAITDHEKRGFFSQALSAHRQVMAAMGVDLPGGDVHVSWHFPWASAPQEFDGSPGRHATLRGVLEGYLSNRSIRELGPWIEQTAVELLTGHVLEQQEKHGAQGTGTIDFAQFTDTLAFHTMSELAGFPHGPEDEAFIKTYLDDVRTRTSFAEMLRPEGPEVRPYFDRIIAEHRDAGGGGLLAEIAAAHDAGLISRDEKHGLIFGCWSAGRDTTATLTALMLGLLAEAGLQSSLLSNLGPDGASWRHNVINESLRFTPFPANVAVCMKSVELDDFVIERNSVVTLHWEAGNRDPEAFGEDADRFEPGRRAKVTNLGFGRGLHYCVGAPLARYEADVVLRTVGSILGHYELTDWVRVPRVVDVVEKAEVTFDIRTALNNLRELGALA
ncbi:cytochrome P450 [Nocardia sp. NPDC050799]|uniref:cytochrome P450 n=1 Tax=Nocardia sp. NPDC050799 TaxID=3154842 RepID=UPI0033F2452B